MNEQSDLNSNTTQGLNKPVGFIADTLGVKVERINSDESMVELKVGDALNNDDVIKIAGDSHIVISLMDGSIRVLLNADNFEVTEESLAQLSEVENTEDYSDFQELLALIESGEDITEELDITVLMVEHDMNLVNQVSDRVLALADGELLAVGTPKEIQEHPEVLRALRSNSPLRLKFH